MICNVYLLTYICLLAGRLTLMLLIFNWLFLSLVVHIRIASGL